MYSTCDGLPFLVSALSIRGSSDQSLHTLPFLDSFGLNQGLDHGDASSTFGIGDKSG